MNPCSASTSVIALSALLSSLGCSTPIQRIPTGHWVGEGRYVDYEAAPVGDVDDTPSTRTKDGEYPTRLTITSERVFDQPALVFDIESQRGRLMNVGEERTHIRMALVEQRRLDNGTTLYAVADWKYNPGPNETWDAEHFHKCVRFVSAVSFTTDRGLVLQLYYFIPTKSDPVAFEDTLIFDGDTVVKTGSVVQTDQIDPDAEREQFKLATIYWAERLKRAP